MRLASNALALSAALTASLICFSVQAQTDQERSAARALAESGIALQSSGQYLEALDKLQRAQQLVDAPPHLLHIAQCQVQVGRLVEASETYYKLSRMTLAATAPAAFRKAQADGTAELAALRPRIPMLTIKVEPSSAKDPTIKIDGVAISSALIGVEQPVNPGDHVVEVSAQGFSSTTVKLSMLPSAKRTETIAIKENGAAIAPVVVPPAAGTVAPPADSGTTPPVSAPPNPEAPKPPRQEPPGTIPDSSVRNHDGFFLRMALGVGSLANTVSMKENSGSYATESKLSGTGPAFEFSMGGTIVPGLVLGGSAIGHSFSDPKLTIGGQSASSNVTNNTATLVGVLVDYYPMPKTGLHIGVVLGESVTSLKLNADGAKTLGKDTLNSSGFGWAGHIGYEFWVSSQWSIGGMLRYYGTTVESEDIPNGNQTRKTKSEIAIPSFLVNATFH